MDFNKSDWTDGLIDPVSSFRVSVPSQNPYTSIKISSETPETTLQQSSKKINNVKFSENRFLLENGFFESRPRMAALADPQSGKCSYIDPLSFIFSKKKEKTGLSQPKHSLLPQVFDLDPSFSMEKSVFIWSLISFISGRTYSLLRRVRHDSKIESKSDLLNQKYPKMSFFKRK